MIARIAVLLIAHTPLASAMADCARHVYACAPEALSALEAVDIAPDMDQASALALVRERLARLPRDRGMLVLTDMFGATPANVAAQLAEIGRIEVLTGVNLPMLVRSLCYCDQLSLAELADKAASGATAAVMRLAPTPQQNQRPARVAPDLPDCPDHGDARLHHQQ